MIMNRRRFAARGVAALLASLGGSQVGCSTGPSGWHAPSVSESSRLARSPPIRWSSLRPISRTLEQDGRRGRQVLRHRVGKPAGPNDQDPAQMGATVLEPWALDSVTIEDRFEASLQTIRRVAIIHIDPAPTGGYLVKVEVYKFLEDMAKPDRQPAGRAVFTNDFPVNRTREIVGPVPAPLGWIQARTGPEPGASHPGRHP